jgi:hypothetical protein
VLGDLFPGKVIADERSSPVSRRYTSPTLAAKGELTSAKKQSDGERISETHPEPRDYSWRSSTLALAARGDLLYLRKSKRKRISETHPRPRD